MTRERIHGSDTEFCAWMRVCSELPSYSSDFGFVASDSDVIVHRYMTSIDSQGSREVQGVMQIEVKTRRGKPSFSQFDTLSKLNVFSGHKQVDGVFVHYFGVFILVMSGTSPDDSEFMWWVDIPKERFLNDAKQCRQRPINKQQLIELLRFELHPRNFTKRVFRRHHLTRVIVQEVQTPLGFTVEEKITKRS